MRIPVVADDAPLAIVLQKGLDGSPQCEANGDGQEVDLAQNLAGPPDQDPLTLYLASER